MLTENPPLRWTFDVDGAYKVLETWGVWCTDHDRWVARGSWTEREAWQVMLGLESTHPMRLEVRSYNRQGPTQSEGWIECTACSGVGDCDCCGQRCPTCHGTGEIERDHHAYARAS